MSAAVASTPGRRASRTTRMSLTEMAWRLRDQVVRVAWSPRQVTRHGLARAAATTPARALEFTAVLPPGTAALVPEETRRPVLETAGRVLQGEWETLGVLRTDLERPDWFRDPVTGRRYAQDSYAFRINHRSYEQVGNIKQAWELSRLQHLTLLATAWFLTRDERYARRAADHLRSWWRENPFLSGVHWTSGIELGVRLISLVWIRRLLDDWPGVADLFERDALALRQIRWHQQYLAAFTSRGPSVGNYVIAEAAGQLVVSCAFPWFRESERWRRESVRLLERELARTTFPSGIGLDGATDCRCFVVELGFVAAVEADVCGHPLRPATWARLCALADSAAALVDERMRPPRQCGLDEGRGLLLDAPTPNHWPSMLALAGALVGRQDWWPRPPATAASSIVGALAGSGRQIADRPSRRPSHFADAGITLLRTSGKDEIWCQCDGGSHRTASIAEQAHADVLSVEVRYAGVDILTAVGTFHHDVDRIWRSSSRPTITHSRQIEVLDDGDIARWTAEHDENASLDPLVLHRRSVLLDRASRSIDIIDQIDGDSRDIHMAFRLGPDVQAEVEGSCAVLEWPTASTPGTARLELPPGLRWSLHQGETEAVTGWYAPGPGRRVPAVTLSGRGRCEPGMPLFIRLEFLEIDNSGKSAMCRRAVSWTTSATPSDMAPEIRAEAR
jgi:hypothetical protein